MDASGQDYSEAPGFAVTANSSTGRLMMMKWCLSSFLLGARAHEMHLTSLLCGSGGRLIGEANGPGPAAGEGRASRWKPEGKTH